MTAAKGRRSSLITGCYYCSNSGSSDSRKTRNRLIDIRQSQACRRRNAHMTVLHQDERILRQSTRRGTVRFIIPSIVQHFIVPATYCIRGFAIMRYTNKNKSVSRLERRKSYHTALRYVAAPNSECPPSHGAQFRLPHCDFYIAHPGSNAAAVTPRQPKFAKIGEDLSG